MKGAILYYSFGGSTAKFATDFAKENGYKVFSIKEKKKRTIFGAFLKGCRQAMKRQSIELEDAKLNWTGIERVAVACPVWAGYPAPAFNNMIKLVPKKMPIELYFISGSGSTRNSRAATEAMLIQEGYNIVGYHDVMTRSIFSSNTEKKA